MGSNSAGVPNRTNICRAAEYLPCVPGSAGVACTLFPPISDIDQLSSASSESRQVSMLLDRLPLGASAPGRVLRNTRAFTVWLRAGYDPGPCLLLVLAVTPNQWLWTGSSAF